MTEAQILALINTYIVTNGNNEITADVLAPILRELLSQPNDKIGELVDLNTTDKTSIVNAINELVNNSNSGFNIHTGTADPNVTQPATFGVGDWYIRNGLSLYQYNGDVWVLLSSDNSIQTLQQVTSKGNQTDKVIEVEGVKFNNLRNNAAVSAVLGTTGDYPDGITIDNSGNIYTANFNSNNVSKITPDGVSTIFANTGTRPVKIAIDELGNIYTTNDGSNNVSKITPDGNSTIFANTGTRPNGILIDELGNIYTANFGSNNVSKITPDGTSTILGTTGTTPVGIAIDNSGNIYTTNGNSNNVSKITPDGTSTILGITGARPNGILIDELGNIYTTNNNSHNVSKITPDGTSTIFANTGNAPQGITIDNSGNIYTTNSGSNNVSKITPDGTSTILGTTGDGPYGITIGNSGNIYTTNYSSNDVSKITIPKDQHLGLDENGNIVLKEVERSELTPDELAGIQNANGLNTGNPVATIGDLLQNVTIVNILDFGAVGNGTTESAQFIQDALDFAEANGIRRVYAPSGNYLLEATIYIPTEIEFYGDGMDKTIFKIDNNTVLDTIGMFIGSTERVNFYTPVISTKTTRTGATLNNILLKDFAIDNIYYDDTGLTTQVCPMLILNTKDSTLRNVDFGSVESEREQAGILRECLGVSFAFAENILLDKCKHKYAGYEVVSIRFLSKNITTRQNVFNIDKPSNLARVLHAVQVARPTGLVTELDSEYGETLCKGYTSDGDIFNLISNYGAAITVHAAKTIRIVNTNTYAIGGDEDSDRVFNLFHSADEVVISGNIINYVEQSLPVSESFFASSMIRISITNLNHTVAEVHNWTISDNVMNLELNRDVSSLTEREITPLVGNLTTKFHNTAITNNVVNITGTGIRDQAVFGFYGSNIIASGNVVNFDGTVSQNMRAFVVEGGDTINVVNNSAFGNHAYSLKINDVETLENLIVGSNNFPEEVLNLRKDKTKTISYNTEIASGTVINLDNPNGRTVDSPEYNATYTFNTDTIVRGGNETREITTLGETEFPEITGATLLAGSDFEADAIFEMIVYTLNGTDVYYFFLLRNYISI